MGVRALSPGYSVMFGGDENVLELAVCAWKNLYIE